MHQEWVFRAFFFLQEKSHIMSHILIEVLGTRKNFLPFVLKRTRSLMELPATERNVLRLLAMSAHFLVLLGPFAILESFDTLDLQRFIPRERRGEAGAELQDSSSSACVIQLVPALSTATYSLDC